MTYVPPYIGPKYKTGGVMVVGRDPGADEVRVGEPLVGKSGQLFDSVLPISGLRREELVITNRVLHRPPNNIFEAHKWQHIEEGKKALFELIDRTKPDLIICLGNQAAYDLILDWPDCTENDHYTRKGLGIKSASGVLERRGFFYRNTEINTMIFGTLHPAAALYKAMPQQLLFEADFRRVGMYLRGQLPYEELPEVEVLTHPKQLERIYNSVDPVSFDIEVKWGGQEFLCASLTGDDLRPIVGYYEALPLLTLPVKDPDVSLLAHNGLSFDTYFWRYIMGEEINNLSDDTIHLWWAMYPELAGKADTGAETFARGKKKSQMTRKGLSFLASWFLNVPYWKFYTSDKEQMGVLCGIDTWVTKKCYTAMVPYAEQLGVMEQYRNSMAMVPALNKMLSRGMRVDKDLYKERLKALRKRQRQREKEAHDIALRYLQEQDIRDPLWYADKRCDCCFGGNIKSRHCTSCLGLESGFKVQELREALGGVEGTRAELLARVDPCSQCGGIGTIPTWDLNIMSGQQLQKILFDHLGTPTYICGRDGPNAQETTLKKVRDWAK